MFCCPLFLLMEELQRFWFHANMGAESTSKNMAETGHEMPIFHHIPRWRSACTSPQLQKCRFVHLFQWAIKLSSPFRGLRIKLPLAGPSSWTQIKTEKKQRWGGWTCEATWPASYILVRCANFFIVYMWPNVLRLKEHSWIFKQFDNFGWKHIYIIYIYIDIDDFSPGFGPISIPRWL